MHRSVCVWGGGVVVFMNHLEVTLLFNSSLACVHVHHCSFYPRHGVRAPRWQPAEVTPPTFTTTQTLRCAQPAGPAALPQ